MLDTLREIIFELNNNKGAQITGDTAILTDLGLSSLELIDLIVKVEEKFNVEIPDRAISSIVTVQDLQDLISGNEQSINNNRCANSTFNVDDYPLPKTKRHIRKLKHYMRLSRFLWRFEVSGLENVPPGGQYILCPNHQSYYDSLWIWAALGDKRVDLWKICCLAAEVFVPKREHMTMLGGIPVDRKGNTVPSMKRAYTCIQNGYTMLIHPEGTRTRDGKMGTFKGGAAKLAIDAGVPVIPVRIDGAWDIYPPHRKFPKVFRFGRRYPIRIQFGKPIEPFYKSVEELTAILQSEVERMGEGKSRLSAA